MTDQLKIAVAGIGGRMGRQLVAASLVRGHQISGGSEAASSDLLGRMVGDVFEGSNSTKEICSEAGLAGAGADVWVDFTVPAATLQALEALLRIGTKALVVGTTGFTPEQEQAFAEASQQMAIVKAGNFSLGVNLLEALVKQAAARLGPDWDIEVLETHHKRKLDAPSGTALMLGEAAAAGRGASLSTLRTPPYDGPDAKREAGKIGFSVRRSGGVIGEHEVTFGSDAEIVSLSHSAIDRSVFAYGAIKACEWVVGQPAGLYDMSDVLGL
ncbi:MAG: 4-hydroxy-tetrahydrodipicolinate reductase [Henriciella sp.]|nr:4-hydroxy-tetrahydrodipicolinate reductase [Henriciella sp.]